MEPPGPEVLVEHRAGVAVVTLRGEFDVATVASLQMGLESVDPGARAVVDLADVQFLDSTAVSALVTALRRQRAAGGDLVLAGPDARLSRLLVGILALDQVTAVYRSVAEALADDG